MVRHTRHSISTPSSSSYRHEKSKQKIPMNIKGNNEYENIDIKEFELSLQKLLRVASVEIDKLDAADKETFDHVIKVFKTVYGCSAYAHLYKMMLDVFKGVAIKRGTVSSYLLGCQIKTKQERVGCGEFCSHALPAPEHKWEACEYSVFAYGKTLSLLYKAHKSTGCLIYVSRKSGYVGLSVACRDVLVNMHISTVVVLDSDTEETIESITDFSTYNWQENTNESDSTWLAWVLVIGVIIVILVLLAFYIVSGPRDVHQRNQRNMRSGVASPLSPLSWPWTQ